MRASIRSNVPCAPADSVVPVNMADEADVPTGVTGPNTSALLIKCGSSNETPSFGGESWRRSKGRASGTGGCASGGGIP